MTDPWADVREWLRQGKITVSESRDLLTDADALLAVVRVVVEDGHGFISDNLPEDTTDKLLLALAALPEHLRG